MAVSSTQVKVAQRKAQHPEEFCPASKCLWRTGGGYCPRHEKKAAEAFGAMVEGEPALKEVL